MCHYSRRSEAPTQRAATEGARPSQPQEFTRGWTICLESVTDRSPSPGTVSLASLAASSWRAGLRPGSGTRVRAGPAGRPDTHGRITTLYFDLLGLLLHHGRVLFIWTSYSDLRRSSCSPSGNVAWAGAHETGSDSDVRAGFASPPIPTGRDGFTADTCQELARQKNSNRDALDTTTRTRCSEPHVL
jgi:hypothetical protein